MIAGPKKVGFNLKLFITDLGHLNDWRAGAIFLYNSFELFFRKRFVVHVNGTFMHGECRRLSMKQ